jgi:hypothetical protein
MVLHAFSAWAALAKQMAAITANTRTIMVSPP